MKLKHIHIDSYKLFHDFDIHFCTDNDPLRIVVIVGINGSGKSTLLEYIRPKRVSSTRFGNICVDTDKGEKTFTVPPSLMQKNYYKQVFESVMYLGASEVDIASKQLEEKILKFVDRFVYLEGKTSFDAYDAIQEILDNVFADFHLQVCFKGLDADRHLRFTNKDGAEFGVDGLSEGEKQVLSKVLPLFASDVKNRVILMDEPDASLHPSWQSYLLPVLRRCAEENDCQFILATHSPQIISSAKRDELRILTRDEEGHVRAMECEDGPYGWTVEKVLDEILCVPFKRTPEVEEQLNKLRKDIEENRYETDEFKRELSELEGLLGKSDRDLTLIRLEVMRRKKKEKHDKDN